MGELGIAIVNANDEMGSRKWYSVADVLGKIDLSDDECFYDNYIDRESENDLHDDEPPSDADSNATEDYTPPAAADAGNISHPDSEHGDGDAAIPAVDSQSAPAFTPHVWERFDGSYVPKVDFHYR